MTGQCKKKNGAGNSDLLVSFFFFSNLFSKVVDATYLSGESAEEGEPKMAEGEGKVLVEKVA